MVVSLLSAAGDADALLGVEENGNDDGGRNIKFFVCVFAAGVLFKKLDAQPLTLLFEIEELELLDAGNTSPHFIF